MRAGLSPPVRSHLGSSKLGSSLEHAAQALSMPSPDGCMGYARNRSLAEIRWWSRLQWLAMLSAGLGVLYLLTRPEPALAVEGQPVKKAERSQRIPMPPVPYSYEGFWAWFNGTSFASASAAFQERPDPKEYDLDLARHGKFGAWMAGPDGEAAVGAAKRVNRYLFSTGILQDGDWSRMANPAMHLYILRELRPAAGTGPRPVFVDAGCGTGFLLGAWRTMVGGAAVGIESSADTASEAQRYLSSDAAFSEPTARGSCKVVVGDALRPNLSHIGLAPGTVDAINVGFAVDSAEDLAPLSRLLRTGGRLTAPICKPRAEQAPGVPATACDALFRVFQKRAELEGLTEEEGASPGVPVRFVRAVLPKSGGGFEGFGLPPSASLAAGRGAPLAPLLRACAAGQAALPTCSGAALARREVFSYAEATEIQARALPELLEAGPRGPDAVLRARAGTGKTLAYLSSCGRSPEGSNFLSVYGLDPFWERLFGLQRFCSTSPEPSQSPAEGRERRPHKAIEALEARASSLGVERSPATVLEIFGPRALEPSILGCVERLLSRPPPGVGTLVVAPSRELVLQITREVELLCSYHPLQVVPLIGGSRLDRDEAAIRRRRPGIVVATPGRIVEHFETTHRFPSLFEALGTLVLDECDSLLDEQHSAVGALLGSLPAPRSRQTLLVSATIPQPVRDLARRLCGPGHRVIDCVGDGPATQDAVVQMYAVAPALLLPTALRNALELEKEENPSRHKAIVFFPTARLAAFMARVFRDRLRMRVHEIHARVDGPLRIVAQHEFAQSPSGVLFTSAGGPVSPLAPPGPSGVSGRGMDYPDVTLVVQVLAPESRDQYVHQVGRTARGGKLGCSLLLLADAEVGFLEHLADLPLSEHPAAPRLLHDARARLASGGWAPGGQASAGFRSLPRSRFFL
ncbi:unnamed protein product [Prorocentrum cordatum]|uniref:ATP-dependent RNA helicase n=1 Tax=Prorocentrum cordatum TaxID=2364126 RepID=A0ABN9T597_9DINO|nr:unnamed protein product [Polarella glacialis]